MQQFEGRLPVNLGRKFCYDIVFADCFDQLFEELCRIVPDFMPSGTSHCETNQKTPFPYDKVLIVTDSNVGPLYLSEVISPFEQNGVPACSYEFPAGEEHKNLDEIRSLYAFMINHHLDRHSLLVALGGGVVGDMTGFAAATYLRGIDFIQIPTTLLAQADSSIGGKTGVDFDEYKNMVGAFKMPKLVFENVSTLKTLDARQYASGFAEVMKAGLIRDEEFYSWLISNMYEILERDPASLQTMIYNADLIKKLVVEKDPYERGDRRLLNLGHTLGHAIEKYLNFTLTHGECVALGCVCAAFLSWKKGYLSSDGYYEIRDMFVPFGLPITVENIDPDAVISLMHSDKKAVNDHVPFVLLKDIGRAFVSNEIMDEDCSAALHEILWEEGEEEQ